MLFGFGSSSKNQIQWPMQENTGHKTQTGPRPYLKTQTWPRKTQGYLELALDQTQGSYDP